MQTDLPDRRVDLCWACRLILSLMAIHPRSGRCIMGFEIKSMFQLLPSLSEQKSLALPLKLFKTFEFYKGDVFFKQLVYLWDAVLSPSAKTMFINDTCFIWIQFTERQKLLRSLKRFAIWDEHTNTHISSLTATMSRGQAEVTLQHLFDVAARATSKSSWIGLTQKENYNENFNSSDVSTLLRTRCVRKLTLIIIVFQLNLNTRKWEPAS